MLKRALVVIVLIVVVIFFGLRMVGRGALGEHEAPGDVTDANRPTAAVTAVQVAQSRAANDIGVLPPKQILFGDLHVHTTFSMDAFLMSLPFSQGEGAHPPADACDFARFCSALDFWSINDHAEGISPAHWEETVDSIRQCNAVGASGGVPDTVAFLGWEWTDVGDLPDEHFGHKNVVLRGITEGEVPARPIAALSTLNRTRGAAAIPSVLAGVGALANGEERLHDLLTYVEERRELEVCDADTHVKDLPLDCIDTAATPADLFRKLDEWELDSIVIPHGTTWGMYTPTGSTWDKQLAGDLHDPDRQTLFEIYSGHGNSDVYRDWRAVDLDADGNATCPPKRASYTPPCWRAGEIIFERCRADGESEDECRAREVVARENAAEALVQAHLTVPGTTSSEWLDAGQCKDCDQPSFNYRPGGSAQYLMALGNFDDPVKPRHFRFGFMSSSDNHFARPGTGFKEVHRRGYTESRNRAQSGNSLLNRVLRPEPESPQSVSRPFDREHSNLQAFALFELERQGSFFMTGGLIGAHATGRDRDSIWDTMQRREVYGTSGPRILLWFDLLNPPGTRGESLAMGSEVEMSTNPIFQVRAVGSFEQKPGCPRYASDALGAERLEGVCKGECYHPSDTRRPITRIEVVRIRPQTRLDEPVAQLIEDPWRSFECEPQPEGCSVSFEDPDFAAGGRNALYYVRAIEAPAPGVNAGGVRCEYDGSGECIEVDLCGGDASDADCLGEHEPKAWSSPIFVDFGGGGGDVAGRF